MKRLSYLHEYATPDGTVVCVPPSLHTPHLLQSHRHSSTVRKTTLTSAVAIPSARGRTAHTCSKKKNLDRENMQPSSKRVPKAYSGAHSTTKPSRRYVYTLICAKFTLSLLVDHCTSTCTCIHHVHILAEYMYYISSLCMHCIYVTRLYMCW